MRTCLLRVAALLLLLLVVHSACDAQPLDPEAEFAQALEDKAKMLTLGRAGDAVPVPDVAVPSFHVLEEVGKTGNEVEVVVDEPNVFSDEPPATFNAMLGGHVVKFVEAMCHTGGFLNTNHDPEKVREFTEEFRSAMGISSKAQISLNALRVDRRQRYPRIVTIENWEDPPLQVFGAYFPPLGLKFIANHMVIKNLRVQVYPDRPEGSRDDCKAAKFQLGGWALDMVQTEKNIALPEDGFFLPHGGLDRTALHVCVPSTSIAPWPVYYMERCVVTTQTFNTRLIMVGMLREMRAGFVGSKEDVAPWRLTTTSELLGFMTPFAEKGVALSALSPSEVHQFSKDDVNELMYSFLDVRSRLGVNAVLSNVWLVVERNGNNYEAVIHVTLQEAVFLGMSAPTFQFAFVASLRKDGPRVQRQHVALHDSFSKLLVRLQKGEELDAPLRHRTGALHFELTELQSPPGLFEDLTMPSSLHSAVVGGTIGQLHCKLDFLSLADDEVVDDEDRCFSRRGEESTCCMLQGMRPGPAGAKNIVLTFNHMSLLPWPPAETIQRLKLPKSFTPYPEIVVLPSETGNHVELGFAVDVAKPSRSDVNLKLFNLGRLTFYGTIQRDHFALEGDAEVAIGDTLDSPYKKVRAVTCWSNRVGPDGFTWSDESPTLHTKRGHYPADKLGLMTITVADQQLKKQLFFVNSPCRSVPDPDSDFVSGYRVRDPFSPPDAWTFDVYDALANGGAMKQRITLKSFQIVVTRGNVEAHALGTLTVAPTKGLKLEDVPGTFREGYQFARHTRLDHGNLFMSDDVQDFVAFYFNGGSFAPTIPIVQPAGVKAEAPSFASVGFRFSNLAMALDRPWWVRSLDGMVVDYSGFTMALDYYELHMGALGGSKSNAQSLLSLMRVVQNQVMPTPGHMSNAQIFYSMTYHKNVPMLLNNNAGPFNVITVFPKTSFLVLPQSEERVGAVIDFGKGAVRLDTLSFVPDNDVWPVYGMFEAILPEWLNHPFRDCHPIHDYDVLRTCDGCDKFSRLQQERSSGGFPDETVIGRLRQTSMHVSVVLQHKGGIAMSVHANPNPSNLMRVSGPFWAGQIVEPGESDPKNASPIKGGGDSLLQINIERIMCDHKHEVEASNLCGVGVGMVTLAMTPIKVAYPATLLDGWAVAFDAQQPTLDHITEVVERESKGAEANRPSEAPRSTSLERRLESIRESSFLQSLQPTAGNDTSGGDSIAPPQSRQHKRQRQHPRSGQRQQHRQNDGAPGAPPTLEQELGPLRNLVAFLERQVEAGAVHIVDGVSYEGLGLRSEPKDRRAPAVAHRSDGNADSTVSPPSSATGDGGGGGGQPGHDLEEEEEEEEAEDGGGSSSSSGESGGPQAATAFEFMMPSGLAKWILRDMGATTWAKRLPKVFRQKMGEVDLNAFDLTEFAKSLHFGDLHQGKDFDDMVGLLLCVRKSTPRELPIAWHDASLAAWPTGKVALDGVLHVSATTKFEFNFPPNGFRGMLPAEGGVVGWELTRIAVGHVGFGDAIMIELDARLDFVKLDRSEMVLSIRRSQVRNDHLKSLLPPTKEIRNSLKMRGLKILVLPAAGRGGEVCEDADGKKPEGMPRFGKAVPVYCDECSFDLVHWSGFEAHAHIFLPAPSIGSTERTPASIGEQLQLEKDYFDLLIGVLRNNQEILPTDVHEKLTLGATEVPPQYVETDIKLGVSSMYVQMPKLLGGARFGYEPPTSGKPSDGVQDVPYMSPRSGRTVSGLARVIQAMVMRAHITPKQLSFSTADLVRVLPKEKRIIGLCFRVSVFSFNTILFLVTKTELQQIITRKYCDRWGHLAKYWDVLGVECVADVRTPKCNLLPKMFVLDVMQGFSEVKTCTHAEYTPMKDQEQEMLDQPGKAVDRYDLEPHCQRSVMGDIKGGESYCSKPPEPLPNPVNLNYKFGFPNQGEDEAEQERDKCFALHLADPNVSAGPTSLLELGTETREEIDSDPGLGLESDPGLGLGLGIESALELESGLELGSGKAQKFRRETINEISKVEIARERRRAKAQAIVAQQQSAQWQVGAGSPSTPPALAPTVLGEGGDGDVPDFNEVLKATVMPGLVGDDILNATLQAEKMFMPECHEDKAVTLFAVNDVTTFEDLVDVEQLVLAGMVLDNLLPGDNPKFLTKFKFIVYASCAFDLAGRQAYLDAKGDPKKCGGYRLFEAKGLAQVLFQPSGFPDPSNGGQWAVDKVLEIGGSLWIDVIEGVPQFACDITNADFSSVEVCCSQLDPDVDYLKSFPHRKAIPLSRNEDAKAMFQCGSDGFPRFEFALLREAGELVLREFEFHDLLLQDLLRILVHWTGRHKKLSVALKDVFEGFKQMGEAVLTFPVHAVLASGAGVRGVLFLGAPLTWTVNGEDFVLEGPRQLCEAVVSVGKQAAPERQDEVTEMLKKCAQL